MSIEPTNASDDAQDPVVGSQPATPGDAQPHAQESAAAGAATASESTQGEEMGEVDMSDFEEQLEDSELSKALDQVAQAEEKLARAHADLYNLNQELEAMIGVLDDIEAARKHGDLNDGPFASIANKLEDTLRTRFELERFGDEGDDFDPMLHEALMAQPSADVDHPVLGQVLQSGYRRGDTIIRAAKVLVYNPE